MSMWEILDFYTKKLSAVVMIFWKLLGGVCQKQKQASPLGPTSWNPPSRNDEEWLRVLIWEDD